MKTVITFKAIRDRKVVFKDIPIEHNFEVIPECEFHGVKLPATSIESQVINYLDETDKRELMDKYGFDIIIDYYPKRKKKTKEEEIKEFIDYCQPLFEAYPQYKRPFEAIISDHGSFIFGRKKSNYNKLTQIMSIYDMVMKGASGTMDMVLKTLKSDNIKKLD